jgi:putative PIN family toxin of toxin-antitoxin system
LTPRTAIIDTNVIVSGLLTAEADAPTAVILDAMVGGGFSYLLSVELLAEYRRVLCRPRIARHHRLSDTEVDALLTELALNGDVRDPQATSTTVPDAGDRHVWALLESDPTAVLVTGDDALLKHAPGRDRVLSPRQFVEAMKSRRP